MGFRLYKTQSPSSPRSPELPASPAVPKSRQRDLPQRFTYCLAAFFPSALAQTFGLIDLPPKAPSSVRTLPSFQPPMATPSEKLPHPPYPTVVTAQSLSNLSPAKSLIFDSSPPRNDKTHPIPETGLPSLRPSLSSPPPLPPLPLYPTLSSHPSPHP